MNRFTVNRLLMFVLIIGSATAAEDTLVERAQKGDAAAQFDLGYRYANGDGVAKDSAEAVKWYRKAVEQGYAPAQSNPGVMYANGEAFRKTAVKR